MEEADRDKYIFEKDKEQVKTVVTLRWFAEEEKIPDSLNCNTKRDLLEKIKDETISPPY